jgi:pimeloyl-ACP methyl ester carboxylesterase
VGHGPDLVLIHGLVGNLAMWHLKVVPLLQDRFRLLTYDLRGHGYSEVPPRGYTTDDMAHDLQELLDALDIARPSLLGHSFGADIALCFALLHPQRVARLVAVDPALPAYLRLHMGAEWPAWDHLAQALQELGITVPPDQRRDIAYLLRRMLEVPKLYGPTTGRPRRPQPILRLLETTLLHDYSVVGALDLPSVARITTPVLLLHGQNSDLLGPYDYLRTHLPQVCTLALPSSRLGHLGPLEQPESLVEATDQFLTLGIPSGVS